MDGRACGGQDRDRVTQRKSEPCRSDWKVPAGSAPTDPGTPPASSSPDPESSGFTLCGIPVPHELMEEFKE